MMAGASGRVFAAPVFLLIVCLRPAFAGECDPNVASLIPRLIEEGRELRSVPFPDVVLAATGKKILPVDPDVDGPWLERLSLAVGRTLETLNAPDGGIHRSLRINEASRPIEDRLRAELNAEAGWSCGIPTTASGEEQRSGYPDLRLVLGDGGVVYLDPKLYSSPESTLRTFYFEPQTETNKIRDDARHLLVAIRHNGKTGADLRLLGWQLIDVSRLRVRLKAEFQASNKDMYRPENVVGRGTLP